jgi:hypothetical protein
MQAPHPRTDESWGNWHDSWPRITSRVPPEDGAHQTKSFDEDKERFEEKVGSSLLSLLLKHLLTGSLACRGVGGNP